MNPPTPEIRTAPPPEEIRLIHEARHHDPGAVLGRHRQGDAEIIRSLLPHASSAAIADTGAGMRRIDGTSVFEWSGAVGELPARVRIAWRDVNGAEHVLHDPYSFTLQIGDYDKHLFAEGRHRQCYRFLGAHPREVDGVAGVVFATWAPNAERVSVVGDFNHWDGRCHLMRSHGGSGLWELFIPGLAAGQIYKYEIRARSGAILLKADPYGSRFELRPGTAAIVAGPGAFRWDDADWLDRRDRGEWQHAPLSVYELHLGSWRRDGNGGFLNYREIANALVPYVKALGCTHIELLPVTEHPLDASWGYQTTGYYAPTSRYGTPDDFRYLVNLCHVNGIGVILDWVAGHFPRDAHALARFDGTALYEHEDPRKGEHREWGTLVFNYDRNEVRSFLASNARYWVSEFHLDGLRVDAVASMIYLDYSREHGEWLPNRHGGNENLEAIDFLRDLNHNLMTEFPGVAMMAEESTAWPMVTRPSWAGGLGFSTKWNMGWMHDTLEYMQKDPVHRHYHHDKLTFGLLYAFNENFVLPLSHDEVVHGKRALLAKMPGDDWQRFANLRLLYTFMYTYPGKKLLFMGGEVGQWSEWDHDGAIDWDILGSPAHAGILNLVGDLNRLYTGRGALHHHDFDSRGFEWIDCHDASQSVISYIRQDHHGLVVVVLNFTPVPRHGYRLGVPREGLYRELLNSDSGHYHGGNIGNGGGVRATAQAWMGRPCSMELVLPPLAGLVLEFTQEGQG